MYFIRDENLAQKIPDRRDIIDGLNSIRASTVGLELESLKDKGLVFRVKILELIDHYGLDYLGYRNGRFHPQKILSGSKRIGTR